MTAQPSTDPVRRIMSMLAGNVDELAQHVASAVRAEVDFYKSTRAVADDDLLASCTENIRFALKSLEGGVAFDTLPAASTGSDGRRRGRQPGAEGGLARGSDLGLFRHQRARREIYGHAPDRGYDAIVVAATAKEVRRWRSESV